MSATDCTLARELASAHLDGVISAAESAALHAHLAECASCRECAAAFARQRGNLRELPQPELPVEMLLRVAQLTRPRWWQRPAFRAAASVLLLAVLGYWWQRTEESLPVETAAAPAESRRLEDSLSEMAEESVADLKRARQPEDASALGAAMAPGAPAPLQARVQWTVDPVELRTRSVSRAWLQKQQLESVGAAVALDAQWGISAEEAVRGALSCAVPAPAMDELLDDVRQTAELPPKGETKLKVMEQAHRADAAQSSEPARRRVFTATGTGCGEAVRALLVQHSKKPLVDAPLAQTAAARRGQLEVQSNRLVVKDRAQQRYQLFELGEGAVADALIGLIEALPEVDLRPAEDNPDSGETVLITLDR